MSLRSHAARRAACFSPAVWALLVACDVSRPEGAYDASDNGLTSYNLDAKANVEGDGPLIAPMKDPEFIELVDGQVVGGKDGGPMVSEQTLRLDRLKGLYVMRADVFGTVSISESNITVSSRTRASYYFLTELGVRKSDLQLVGQERLCHIAAEGTCQSSEMCTLTTEIVSQSIAVAQTKGMVERVYTIDGLDVVGGTSSLPLGYDLTPVDPPTFDPVSLTLDSPQVWDPIGDLSVREGLFVLAKFRGSFLTVPVSFTCNVVSVQRLDTSFAGTLAGTASEPSLEGAELALDTTGSRVKYLKASGDSGSCENLPADDKPATHLAIAFKRADLSDPKASQECPGLAAWDELPAPASP